MYVNPFQLSMDTVIGCSPMLGHRLEDRATVRTAQDRALLRTFQNASTVTLSDPDQCGLFAVAPLDILVERCDGKVVFHPIEINGTGIGGLTNLTGDAVSAVLESIGELASQIPVESPVILVAVSGKENDQSPRLNKLVHEKLLYCEALLRAFAGQGRDAYITTMKGLEQDSSGIHQDRPIVILGYMKEFLDRLELDSDGRLSLWGRNVDAAINDRFCLNVLHRFDHRVDMDRFWTLNRCYEAGADKGVAYELASEYLSQRRFAHLPSEIPHARVYDRQELIDTVLDWVARGRRPVIKPQGTGLGHGIEFFLDAHESQANIIAKIDRSLKQTEEYYHLKGGAFPYTVCEFIDTATVPAEGHPLQGHKFEVRIVVYRDGNELKAFPSIAKISCAKFDAAKPSQESLINNITASTEATKHAGVEFMQPLCMRETLDLLGIKASEMTELCQFATGFMRHVVEQTQKTPVAAL